MNTSLLPSALCDLSAFEPIQTDELSDDALIHILCGERAEWAIEHLYRRYKQSMFGLAFGILRDNYLAEDITQEAFLTLWHKAEYYKKDLGSLKSWLQTIVRNRALDKVRSSLYREYHFAHLDLVNGSDLVSREGDVWQIVWSAEQSKLIQGALAQLPLEQREAIELNYFAGYSHGEIASQLQLPVGTVKGRIRLGLQKIKHLLQANGIDRESDTAHLQ